jgi:DNA replication protein DnaC
MILSEHFEWRNDYVDLTTKFISDSTSEYLSRKVSQYDEIVKRGCPTCDGPNSEISCGQCKEQLQLYKHYLSAGIGITYQRLDWSDYHGDEVALEAAMIYLKKHKQMVRAGFGVLLHGDYGTGKTLLTVLMAKELVKLGYNVYFATFSQMVDEFTRGWGDANEKLRFESKVVKSDIFILDDIGKEFRTKTNLSESTFDHVMRQRALDSRPTFITTNMNMAELKSGYGSAIFSLLTERMVDKHIVGQDYRPIARERAMSEINSSIFRSIK